MAKLLMVIDAYKSGKKDPFAWQYGVAVEYNGLQRTFAFQPAISKLEEIRSIHRAWKVCLVAIACKVIEELLRDGLDIGRLDIKVISCRDLTPPENFENKVREQMVRALRNRFGMKRSATFETLARRDFSRARTLYELYRKAHKAAVSTDAQPLLPRLSGCIEDENPYKL